MKFKVLYVFLSFLPLPLFVGCGEKLPYEVVGIRGTITFEGRPAPKGLRLQFAPANGMGRTSTAFVGEGGKFKAAYTRSVEGIQVGKVILTVGWSTGSDASMPSEAVEIIKKFGAATKGLPLEITKPDKEFRIELK